MGKHCKLLQVLVNTGICFLTKLLLSKCYFVFPFIWTRYCESIMLTEFCYDTWHEYYIIFVDCLSLFLRTLMKKLHKTTGVGLDGFLKTMVYCRLFNNWNTGIYLIFEVLAIWRARNWVCIPMVEQLSSERGRRVIQINQANNWRDKNNNSSLVHWNNFNTLQRERETHTQRERDSNSSVSPRMLWIGWIAPSCFLQNQFCYSLIK